jgi:5-methylcytosine-specific restriction endonuclease McrA
MERSKERTQIGFIVQQLRLLWLKSRERGTALKRASYTCQTCGKKASQAKGKEVKVNVHHKNKVQNWTEIAEKIRDELLCNPDDLVVLCKECHDKAHYEAKG